MGCEALASYRFCQLNAEDEDKKVCEFVSAFGGWNWNSFENHIPSEVCLKLCSIPPPWLNGRNDNPTWSLTKDGEFSTKTAYSLIHGNLSFDGNSSWSKIWAWKGPQKIKYFICMNLGEWIHLNLSKSMGCFDLEWHFTFRLTVWSIWKERNRVVFEDAATQGADMVMSIVMQAKKYLKARLKAKEDVHIKRSNAEVINRWEKPPNGLSSLDLAWSIGLKRILLNSDSECAVKLIREGFSQNHPSSSLLELISQFLINEWEVVISYVRREANHVADGICKNATIQVRESCIFNEPADSIREAISRDVVGIAALWLRRVSRIGAQSMRSVCWLCPCLDKRLKTNAASASSSDQRAQSQDSADTWEIFFDLRTLQVATNFFSELNQLGHGGFGPVYKTSSFLMLYIMDEYCSGYMAPEYALRGYLSVKTDVFSYGVLVLEIVSGRKNNNRQLDEEQEDLLNYNKKVQEMKAWMLYQTGKIMNLIDTSLGKYNSDEAAMCIQLGLLCCQANISDRPDMNAVHLMLSSDSFTLPRPGKPGIHGRVGRWTATSTSTFTNTNATSATRASGGSSFVEDYSRNSISTSSFDEGR
ncbi:putative receptor-like protein kinase [Senna tora]|uniref:Putative receptor-like protein kinase n=1 Tax=Senna tora TaxID=362788 RepID=A0A834WXI9_9FABA|nr:putative receptor-like protein kinase [Senna tora]